MGRTFLVHAETPNTTGLPVFVVVRTHSIAF
jgi:hypothetical protein